MFTASCVSQPAPRRIAFNTRALEEKLVRGVSNEADIRQALGSPVGDGALFWPGSDGPRPVWFYEKIEAAAEGQHIRVNQDVLIVFLKDGRFDGFLWFSDAPEACPYAERD